MGYRKSVASSSVRASNGRRGALLALVLASVPVAAACSSSEPSHPRWDPNATRAGALGTEVCAAGSGVDAPTIEDCLGRGAEREVCLDGVFGGYLANHTTTEALGLLQCLMDADANIELDCHPVAHAIGRDTFSAKGTVDAAFGACDPTCHSGCYHGVMERFLRGDSADTGGHISFAELAAKVATACDPSVDQRLRFQCLHGLGHAIMYYSGYALDTSLHLCDATADDWSKSSCYGGVFMENLVAADPSLRDLSPTDYHYPCDAVAEPYKGDCYSMQTSRMSEMGLGPAAILAECAKAGAYEASCSASLGRDLSNEARVGDPRAVAQVCELATGEQRDACTRGVIYALADNTWDGRYAFRYCRLYTTIEDAAYCYEITAAYLKSFYERTTIDLVAECIQDVPGNQACLAAAAR